MEAEGFNDAFAHGGLDSGDLGLIPSLPAGSAHALLPASAWPWMRFQTSGWGLASTLSPRPLAIRSGPPSPELSKIC